MIVLDSEHSNMYTDLILMFFFSVNTFLGKKIVSIITNDTYKDS